MSKKNPDSSSITVIKPATGWSPIDFKELWAFREILLFLVSRDIKVKYKQTYLGIAWAILQPVANMIVFTLFFGRLAKIPSDGLPYPVFTFTALLPWTYFQTAVNFSSTCLVSNQQLISKIYFPRLLLPVSSSLAALVDLLISSLFLFIIMGYYGIYPSAHLLYVPLFIVLALISALGVGLWLSSINVKYRDVQYTIPFLVQMWLFLTPVVYPASMIPDKYKVLYGLNPMVAVIEGFRWALVDKPFPQTSMMICSISISLVLLISGAYFFKRTERIFADVV